MDQNIANAKLEQAEILKVCKNELDQELSFFSKVRSDMGTWANETFVGREAYDDLDILYDGIYSLINMTRIICGDIGDFCYEQEQINQGKIGGGQ